LLLRLDNQKTVRVKWYPIQSFSLKIRGIFQIEIKSFRKVQRMSNFKNIKNIKLSKTKKYQTHKQIDFTPKELRKPDFLSRIEIRRSKVKSLLGPQKKNIFVLFAFCLFWKINILKITLILFI